VGNARVLSLAVSLIVVGATGTASSLECCHDAIGFEPLPDEIPVQATEFRVVGNVCPTTQPLGERGFKERVVVDVVEHHVDGEPSRGRRDARLFDLTPDSQSASTAQRHLGVRDCFGNTLVVDGALILQSSDRLVYRILSVAFARETLTDLGF
jgi:hypothetical protein